MPPALPCWLPCDSTNTVRAVAALFGRTGAAIRLLLLQRLRATTIAITTPRAAQATAIPMMTIMDNPACFPHRLQNGPPQSSFRPFLQYDDIAEPEKHALFRAVRSYPVPHSEQSTPPYPKWHAQRPVAAMHVPCAAQATLLFAMYENATGQPSGATYAGQSLAQPVEHPTSVHVSLLSHRPFPHTAHTSHARCHN
jgi:hypothetical protein